MNVNGISIVSTDAASKVQKDAVSKPVTVTTHSDAKKPTTQDTTNFTSTNHTVQSLTKTALQTFPTREAKVEALKQAVKGAEYQLDSAKIAASLANANV